MASFFAILRRYFFVSNIIESIKLRAEENKKVIVFDLDASNIGYKLVQRFAKTEAYGSICQCISKLFNRFV